MDWAVRRNAVDGEYVLGGAGAVDRRLSDAHPNCALSQFAVSFVRMCYNNCAARCFIWLVYPARQSSVYRMAGALETL